jgi:hypothetical protein
VRRSTASFTRKLRRVRLRSGARLEVRVTHPDAIGKLVRLRVRARTLPLAGTLCLAPGTNRGTEC